MKPKLAVVPPPAAAPGRLPLIDWTRARGAISATSSRERQERRPELIARDRRAASELRRLARDLPDLAPAEVLARLEAIGTDFGGGAA